MLSFEVVENGAAIQICCDQYGMATLLAALANLIRNAGHVHLRGPTAGGDELSEINPFGSAALSEVIIDFSPDYSTQG